jgi:hypothetical protein
MPRNKRARNPHQDSGAEELVGTEARAERPEPVAEKNRERVPVNSGEQEASFDRRPFAGVDAKVGQEH